MRKLGSYAVITTLVVIALLAVNQPGWAEPISLWGSDAGRASLPGAYVPHDGAPFSHRYNYPEGPLFLWGGYGRNFWYVEQLDREERFEKFGTRYGPDHPPLFNRLFDRHRR